MDKEEIIEMVLNEEYYNSVKEAQDLATGIAGLQMAIGHIPTTKQIQLIKEN